MYQFFSSDRNNKRKHRSMEWRGHVSRDRERVWQTRTRSPVLGAAWERTLRIKIDCATDPCVSIHQPSKTSILFLNLFSLFLFLYWLMIRVVTTQISSQSPRYRWGYVIALIRDVCHLSSPLFSVEGEETVVRASFNQRRLISISEQPSISPLDAPRLLFFFPLHRRRPMSFFLPSFLSSFFSLSFLRARARQTFSAVWNGA